MSWTIAFVEPYIGFLISAAYVLEQNFDGLSWMSTNFLKFGPSGELTESYWSPQQALAFPLALVFLLSVVISALWLVGGYALGRKKGVLLFVVLMLLPGVLNVMGWLPAIRYVPSEYVIGGAGVLGEVSGAFPLLILAMFGGWVVVVFLYDSFALTDSFRQVYDHLWFPTALAAAIFFVSDSGSARVKEGLREQDEIVRSGAAHLLSQVARYEEYCSAREDVKAISCEWVSKIYHDLYRMKHEGFAYMAYGDPDVRKVLYSPLGHKYSQEQVLQIRKEIHDYNQKICPFTKISDGSSVIGRYAPESAVCQAPPSILCSAFPDDAKGVFDNARFRGAEALSIECIIPTLERSKKIIKGYVAREKEIKEGHNYRLLYFVLVAFLVGGKVANASTKLVKYDDLLPEEKRRFLKAVKKMSRRTARGIAMLFHLGRYVFGWFGRSLKMVFQRAIKRLRKMAERAM